MAHFSTNILCPCGSGIKYKKCCQKYHKGAYPPTALLLMKSRYSAYALKQSLYIIKTTHPQNSDYTTQIHEWKKSIERFSEETDFLGLKIIEVIEETKSDEAYVTFHAFLSTGELREKSHFLKVADQWLYLDGLFEV